MATGRSNKLVGQTGEYLVAAELSRMGLIATTFTGNVPHYDIVATDSEFRSILVQVKAITGSSWQFDVSKFANITTHLIERRYCDPRLVTKLDYAVSKFRRTEMIHRPRQPPHDVLTIWLAQSDYQHSSMMFEKMGNCVKEIPVCCQNDRANILCLTEQFVIRHTLPFRATNVENLVPKFRQPCCCRLREILVQKEPHATAS